MKRPEFTDEEKYVIAFYKSLETSKRFMGVFHPNRAYLLASLLLALVGLMQNSLTLVCLGFALLLFFNLYEIYQSFKWGNLFGTIFRKYDDAFDAKDIDP